MTPHEEGTKAMGEPAALDDKEYAEAIDTAVAVVEAVRSDWTPPDLTTHDVFLMARILDTIHAHRAELLDACAIVKAAVDSLASKHATDSLARVESAWSALDELVRPGRSLPPTLRSVP